MLSDAAVAMLTSAVERALMISVPPLQFSDQLEDMLDNLTLTAEQVKHAEPISAHPDKLREQIDETKVKNQHGGYACVETRFKLCLLLHTY